VQAKRPQRNMRPLQTATVLHAWSSTKSIALEPQRDKSLPCPEWFNGMRQTPMKTAHRIIDRQTNQTKHCNCSFADICLPPDECAQSLHSQSVHPEKHSAQASSASECNRALPTDDGKGGWRCRNVSSTNDRHTRFDDCAAARPPPPP